MTHFGLNTKKANNYAFFCPVSKLHLTRSNPIGATDGVTPAILRGLKSNVILDLDDAVDLTTGTLKTGQTPPPPPPPSDPPKSDETNPNQGDAPKRGRSRRKNQANGQETDQVSDQDTDQELTGDEGEAE